MNPISNGNGRINRTRLAQHRLRQANHDPVLLAQLRGLERQVANGDQVDRLLGNSPNTIRRDFLQQLSDPRRDITVECGYPKGASLNAWFLWQMYLDEPLAGRVVEMMPKESWQVSPEVYEVERGQVTTAFEQGVADLGQGLGGQGEDFYLQEQGSTALNEVMLRADILSGVGQYGVIVLGLNDGLDLALPAQGVVEQGSVFYEQDRQNGKPVPGSGKMVGNDAGVLRELGQNARQLVSDGQIPYRLTVNADATLGRKLAFTWVLPEHLAPVTRWESNPRSPRWGQPVQYSVTFSDPESNYATGIGAPQSTRMVHWTRVVHLADTAHTASASSCLAIPRIRPVMRPILDAAKVRGASGEGYWKAAFTYLFFQTHPQLGGDVDVDEDAMADLYENFANGLQRAATLKGMSPAAIAPTVSDPTAHRAQYIEDICIKAGWPVRVFKGSERGELASSQDDAAWNDDLRQRQWGYNTCRITAPLYNRLIMLGVLPRPDQQQVQNSLHRARVKRLVRQAPGGVYVLNAVTGLAQEYVGKAGYRIWWPDLTSQTDQERAQVLATRTTAWSTYASGSMPNAVTPFDFATRFDHMTEDEARAMLDDAMGEQAGLELEQPPTDQPPGPTDQPPAPAPTPQTVNVMNTSEMGVVNERMCWGRPCPDGVEDLGTIKDKEGKEYPVRFDKELRTYSVGVPGKEDLLHRGVTAGAVTMTRKGDSVSSVGVHSEFQRKGIASALYDKIEEHTQKPLTPNWALTPDGEALWKAREARKKPTANLANCGGKGGTPGPCPSAGVAQAMGDSAAKELGDIEDQALKAASAGGQVDRAAVGQAMAEAADKHVQALVKAKVGAKPKVAKAIDQQLQRIQDKTAIYNLASEAR